MRGAFGESGPATPERSGGYAPPPSTTLAARLRALLPPEGVNVPLHVAFTGLRGVPVLALGTNSASPLLRLFEDHMEARVLFRRSRAYGEIERVEVVQALSGSLFARVRDRPDSGLVEITWHGRPFTFSARLAFPATLGPLLAFFERRGVTLGPHAAARVGPFRAETAHRSDTARNP